MAEEKSVGISMEDVFRLLSQLDDKRHAEMLEFAKELKKPTEREQIELDKKESRVKAQQEARLRLAQAEEDRKKNAAMHCSHSTYHPGTGQTKHQWRAQVHTPKGEKPYFVPTCTICWTQLPKILATTDQLQNGVQLDQYQGIDAERLRKWAEESQQLQAV